MFKNKYKKRSYLRYISIGLLMASSYSGCKLKRKSKSFFKKFFQLSLHNNNI